MSKYRFISLRQRPELKEKAAKWFSGKWGVPEEAYLECIENYLSHKTEYGWYLCLIRETIAGGMGVIENDFHDRKDLSPNVCAVYTEEIYRGKGIAGKSVWKFPLAGLEFQVPDFIKDAHGGIRAMGGREKISGTGIVSMDVVYFSMTESEYYDLVKKLADYSNDTEDIDEFFGLSRRFMETSQAINRHRHPLFSIMGIGNNGGPEEILAAEKKESMQTGLWTEEELDAEQKNLTFSKIGSFEDYNFFYVQKPMDEEDLEHTAADGDVYKTEYQALFNAKDQVVPNFTFSRPVGIQDLVSEGTGLSFETLDIHDNPVKSEDIFPGHKVTMLNIWATTCTACISEMPELMRLNKEFEEKGGQIVGLVFDAVEDDLIAETKEIAAELEIDFLTLLPNDYLRKTFDAISYPTTYFVNEKGEIMGEPLMGAKISAYQERMSEYLDK